MANNFLKNIWYWAAAVIIIGGLFFYLRVSIPAQPEKTTLPEPTIGAQLNIVSNNGKTRSFQGLVSGTTTILEVLYSASKSGSFDFRYSISRSRGVSLLSLDGIHNAGDKKWRFYLNGKEVVTSAISKIIVKNGDLIEVRFK